MLTRRSFLVGSVAAPLVVRASSLMQVKGVSLFAPIQLPPGIYAAHFVDARYIDARYGRTLQVKVRADPSSVIEVLGWDYLNQPMIERFTTTKSN